MTEGDGSAPVRSFTLMGGKHRARPLAPGLYLVATPIGNLADITLRALETLAGADTIACEDTRVSRVLLTHYGIAAKLIAYHEHNAQRVRPQLLAALDDGRAVALISDAGTPLISDPGYRLVEVAVAAGHAVIPIPGASALLAGMVVSGLPSDTFLFAGFLPSKSGPRQRRLEQLAHVPASLVFYESPNRLAAALADMAATLGADRPAAVARELTKKFEETRRGALGRLAAHFAAHPVKGEIVIMVGPPGEGEATEIDVDAALREALDRVGAGQAAGEVAKATGLDRRALYKRAIELRSGASGAPDE